MLYAPVVIPTLCRYEHFKACLESLSLCTGAENTDDRRTRQGDELCRADERRTT